MTCLGPPSIDLTKQEFKSVIFSQPSQLWSLDFIFQRASILAKICLQGVTMIARAVKARIFRICSDIEERWGGRIQEGRD